MEPKKDLECTLVDLLDRILDKGVILNADLVITVAGTPLVGINLRAALAGMETMLDYGMMEPWDESIREWYAKEYGRRKEAPLVRGERVILKTYGSHYHSEGICKAWRSGFLYLTNKRLFLFRKSPPTVLFETELDKIKGLAVEKKKRVGKVQKNLLVEVEGKECILVHTADIDGLKNAITKETRLPLPA